MKLYGTRRLFGQTGDGVAPPVDYLLRATFDAGDVGYANGQVLNTEPEMGANFAGQLTIAEISGTIGIVSNECSFTDPTAWDRLGFFSQAIARAFGYGLLFQFTDLLGGDHGAFYWSDAGAVSWPPSNGYAMYRSGVGNACHFILQVGGVTQLDHSLFAWANSVDYLFAMVLGGYDVNGVPWRAGEAKASYFYGMAMYVQGGAWGGDWHLLWRCRELNTATMYVVFNDHSCVGNTDDVRVPDLDLSDAYVIGNYSTFTAANGTSLDAITPEIGGAWTEQDGTWDIQGNEANLSVSGGAGQQDGATVDSGLSDGLIEVTATPAAGTLAGIRLRYDAAGPTFWVACVNDPGNLLVLYEYNAGFTVRASAAFAVVGGTPYHLLVSMDGQRIDVCVDDDVATSYASAALNETETEHGIHTSGVNSTFDNFVVYPKTHAVYDTVLDAV